MVTAKDVGRRVEETAGRIGILRDVINDFEDPADPPWNRRKRPTAFIQPEAGGIERLISPSEVERA